MSKLLKIIKQFVGIVIISCVVLELFFFCRIALMRLMPAQSTTFERTAVLELFRDGDLADWHYVWLNYDDISENLKRAVVASEDSRFNSHYGIEWDAIMNAWKHNQGRGAVLVRGGSTISQQLAKNLFLSTEQTYLRKAQELYITLSLELLLSKEQLLELYLNHAEWGRGIYGVEASAQHYYGISATKIGAVQASKIAAMLPKPRFFMQHPRALELDRRAQRIRLGMPLVDVP